MIVIMMMVERRGNKGKEIKKKKLKRANPEEVGREGRGMKK